MTADTCGMSSSGYSRWLEAMLTSDPDVWMVAYLMTLRRVSYVEDVRHECAGESTHSVGACKSGSSWN